MRRLQFPYLGGSFRLLATLPGIPYVLPESTTFAAERSGTLKKDWLQRLPMMKAAVRNSLYVASKEALWSAPAHEAVDEVASRMAYHDIARYVMEHSWFHLFHHMIVASDAPLPHVMYEDFMKCKTFGSLQGPPETQFALEPNVLRSLFCAAAHVILGDVHYFSSAEALFRMVEQQQRVGSEVLSSWLLCCAAAGRTHMAVQVSKSIALGKMPLDPVVFALLMHPHADPTHLDTSLAVLGSAKGFVMQQRLQQRLQTVYDAASVAVHGLFAHYSLTLQHVQKWEVLRHAVDEGVVICDRTVQLALHVFVKERGRRCGPKTIKALVRVVVSSGTPAELISVLLCCRKNELLPEFAELPPTEFDAYEMQYVRSRVLDRSEREQSWKLAAPVIDVLMVNADPELLERAMRKLPELISPLVPLVKGEEGTAKDGVKPVLCEEPPNVLTSATEPMSSASEGNHGTAHEGPLMRGDDGSEEVHVAACPTTTVDLLRALTQSFTPMKPKSRTRRSRSCVKQRKSAPVAPGTIVVSSAIEGRHATQAVFHEGNADVKGLLLSTTLNELEARADADRRSRWQTAWINPDD